LLGGPRLKDKPLSLIPTHIKICVVAQIGKTSGTTLLALVEQHPCLKTQFNILTNSREIEFHGTDINSGKGVLKGEVCLIEVSVDFKVDKLPVVPHLF
jgi:hypothetical protein